MAELLNRARMVTRTTGTGTMTLGPGITGFATLAEAGAANATQYSYVIEEGDDFEIGIGTYTTGSATLSRDAVTLSKINGTSGTTKMNLLGSAIVSVTPRAEDLADISDAAADAIQAAQEAEAAQAAAEAAMSSVLQPLFTTKSAAEAYNPSVAPDYIETSGYTTAGDYGGALYKKVGSEPSHDGKIQIAQGSWYELAEPIVTPEMFGAVGDGTTNDAAAIISALELGRKVSFSSRTYLSNSEIVCGSNDWLHFNGTTLKTSGNITQLRFGAGSSESVTYASGGMSGHLHIEGSGVSNTSNNGLAVRNYSYGSFVLSLKITNCGGTAFLQQSYARGSQHNHFGGGWEITENFANVFVIDAGATSGGYVNNNTYETIRTHDQSATGITHGWIKGLTIDSNRFLNVSLECTSSSDVLLNMDTGTNNFFFGLSLDGIASGGGTTCLDIASGVVGNYFFYTKDGRDVIDASGQNFFTTAVSSSSFPRHYFGSGNNTAAGAFWQGLARPSSTNEFHFSSGAATGYYRFTNNTKLGFGNRDGGDNAPFEIDPTNKRLTFWTLPSTAIGAGPKYQFDGRFSSSGDFGEHGFYQDSHGLIFNMQSGYGVHSSSYLSIADGMTAPAAVTGRARIYVDTADGDLKIIFADGTIKTIVTDT
jgi:hypothetical protein